MKERFKRQLSVSGSIIVLSIAFGVVAVYVLSGMVNADAGQIVTDKNNIAGASAAVDVLANLEAQAPKAAVYAAQINNLLPTHDALFGFSPWLTGIAQAHHVSVAVSFTGNNIGATTAMPGSDSFSMSANGNASDLAAFLDDIESKASGFLLSVDSFTFTNQGSSYQLSAQGKVFSQASTSTTP